MDVFIPPYNTIQTNAVTNGQIIDYWHNLMETSKVDITKGNKAVVYVLDTAELFVANDLPKEGNKHSYNATGQTNDSGEHGHLVAGMIAGQNNDIGMLGVSPETIVIPVKALHVNSGTYQWIIKGLQYIRQHFKSTFKGNRIGIINMSFGGGTTYQPFYDELKLCVKDGLIPVAAAGNDGGNVNYPGAWDDLCITVTALDKNLNPPSWTSKGTPADIASFGVSVVSTASNNTYPKVSGTSFSSPLIAGVVALIATHHYDSLKDAGKETKNLVEGHLKKFAEDILDSGEDQYGAGYTIIKPYLDNPIDNSTNPPDEPEYPEKELRELTFEFNNYQILWGNTISPKVQILDLEQEGLTTNSSQWMYIDKLIVKTLSTQLAEKEYLDLKVEFDNFFRNRGLVLFKDSDINDAAYWTNRFMKLLIKDVSFDTITMEVSDDLGTNLIWYGSNT